MATWLTSDLHLFHRNIIKYCERPFCDEYEMNEALVSMWNAVVEPDDRVIVVGDLTAGLHRRDGELASVIARLRGHKILVRGNHDHLRASWYVSSGFEQVVRHIHEDQILYVHKPATEMNEESIRLRDRLKPRLIVHGHIHERRPELEGHFNVAWDRHGRMVSLDEIISYGDKDEPTTKTSNP